MNRERARLVGSITGLLRLTNIGPFELVAMRERLEKTDVNVLREIEDVEIVQRAVIETEARRAAEFQAPRVAAFDAAVERGSHSERRRA